MCDMMGAGGHRKKVEEKEDAAVLLSNLLYKSGSVYADAEGLRALLRDKWDTICKLAHQIHDEETIEQKKLDRAMNVVANCGVGGIKSAILGEMRPELFRDFELVAKAVLKQK